jgi:hypothetical protein
MFSDNLKSLVGLEGYNPRQFSQIVGVKYGTFHSWIRGEREPRFNVLIKIKEEYLEKMGKEINLDWLITGKGEMFITKN